MALKPMKVGTGQSSTGQTLYKSSVSSKHPGKCWKATAPVPHLPTCVLILKNSLSWLDHTCSVLCTIDRQKFTICWGCIVHIIRSDHPYRDEHWLHTAHFIVQLWRKDLCFGSQSTQRSITASSSKPASARYTYPGSVSRNSLANKFLQLSRVLECPFGLSSTELTRFLVESQCPRLKSPWPPLGPNPPGEVFCCMSSIAASPEFRLAVLLWTIRICRYCATPLHGLIVLAMVSWRWRSVAYDISAV